MAETNLIDRPSIVVESLGEFSPGTCVLRRWNRQRMLLCNNFLVQKLRHNESVPKTAAILILGFGEIKALFKWFSHNFCGAMTHRKRLKAGQNKGAVYDAMHKKREKTGLMRDLGVAGRHKKGRHCYAGQYVNIC